MTIDILVRDLHFSYPPVHPQQSSEPVLRGVGFEVQRGQFVALLGRVGAGKSTLCMALNGLIPHATGGVFRGDVLVRGQNTKEHSVAELAPLVGFVFQDPEVQLVHTRVEDEVAFGPENLGIPPSEIASCVDWAVSVTGLTGYRDRSPLQLSGGEKQRVAIASILAMRPQMIVLDEPTASLDSAGKAAIFGVLADLRERHGMTIVMATQEVDRAFRYADRILVLHEGRIVLNGSPGQLLRQKRVLKGLGVGLPEMVELSERLSDATGRRYRFHTMSGAFRRLRREMAEGNAGSPAPKTPVVAEPRLLIESPQVHIEQLSYSYDEDRSALADVGLSIFRGDFVALMGPNGSGKTTLARHLNGLLRPTRGTVELMGENTRTKRVAELARQVGYVFQNPDHQIFSATVRDEIAFGLRAQGFPAEVVTARVAAALETFGLTIQGDQPPATLGYGQRRLVALASVLVAEPAILILDEPTDGLDVGSREEIMEVIRRFNEKGGSVLLITHDTRLAAEYARRVVVLTSGRVVFDGMPAALFADSEVMAQAGLRPPLVTRLAERVSAMGRPGEVLTPAEFVAMWKRSHEASPATDRGAAG